MMELGWVEASTAVSIVVWLLWIVPWRPSPVVFFHVEKVLVEVPIAVASSFIRNVDNLPIYEQKVHSSYLQSTPTTTKTTTSINKFNVNDTSKVGRDKDEHQVYTLSGGWCGFPWTATFDMHFLSNGGFHSRIVPLGQNYTGITASLLGIIGGFSLRDSGGGMTCVAHYEQYTWPGYYPLLWIPGVKKIWAKWHARGMEIEMQTIKIAMEAYHKHEGTLPKDLAAVLFESHMTFARFLKEVITGLPYSLPDVGTVCS